MMACIVYVEKLLNGACAGYDLSASFFCRGFPGVNFSDRTFLIGGLIGGKFVDSEVPSGRRRRFPGR